MGGPYDEEARDLCLSAMHERVAREIHEERMQELIDERELMRAQGEYSDGEDEYYNEAAHQGYEEENFSEYPTAQEEGEA
ncbi:hypothetical protein H0H92_004945 [Tricholoma furcatifolium]|nr:hypothetical protein H0H92_004945 [Tricholoma furcatifolium]